MEKEEIPKYIYDLLALAAHAPSGDNSQPWRFLWRTKQNILSLYNLPEKDNPILNFRQGGSYVAHGALLENIIIAARAYGLSPDVRLFPDAQDETRIADVFLIPDDYADNPLFPYIAKRHTNRKPYFSRACSDEQKKYILDSAREIGAGEIKILEDEEKKKIAGAALASIEQVILEHKNLHSLLFKDVVWTEREERRKRSGLYIKTMEFNPVQTALFFLAQFWPFMRLGILFGFPRFIAREDAKLYSTGSFIGAIIMSGEKREDHIFAGRILERVWLKVMRLGMSFHPITAIFFAMERVRAGECGMFSFAHQEIIKKNYQALARVFETEKPIILGFRAGFAPPASARSSRLPPLISISHEDI